MDGFPPPRQQTCAECAEFLARCMGQEPSDILEEMLRRTRIIGDASRSLVRAVRSHRRGEVPRDVEDASDALLSALAEANAFRNRTPAECVVSAYLHLARPAARAAAAKEKSDVNPVP